MNKNFHYVQTADGYDVKFNSTVIETVSTVKIAKKKIQEYKNNFKHNKVCEKIHQYGKHLSDLK